MIHIFYEIVLTFFSKVKLSDFEELRLMIEDGL
jgi:hypothetical protein